MGFTAIPTAVGGFFFSSFLAMILWGSIAPWFEVRTIHYGEAMVITIAIWLVVAPLAAAVRKKGKW